MTPTPFKALRHNLLKTGLIYTSLTVAISAIFLITAISSGIIGMYSSMLQTNGDIIVTEKGIADTFFSEVDPTLMKSISKLDGVRSASALIYGASPVDSIPITGIYGVSQNRFPVYQLTQGQYPKSGQVLLGHTIAETLEHPESVKISDTSFIVSGIFESGIGFEDGGVVMPLSDASKIFHKSASLLLISVAIEADTSALLRQINALDEGIEASTTESFVDNYNQFKIISTSGNAISAIAFLMGLLGIGSMMSMVVNDRRSEFGIMRAIGISKASIIQKLFTEALLLTSASFLSAWILSEIILYSLKHAEKLQGYINGEITPEVLGFALLAALGMALLGSLLPAMHASRTDPILLIQKGA